MPPGVTVVLGALRARRKSGHGLPCGCFPYIPGDPGSPLPIDQTRGPQDDWSLNKTFYHTEYRGKRGLCFLAHYLELIFHLVTSREVAAGDDGFLVRGSRSDTFAIGRC